VSVAVLQAHKPTMATFAPRVLGIVVQVRL
jgi:hypothetical protein